MSKTTTISRFKEIQTNGRFRLPNRELVLIKKTSSLARAEHSGEWVPMSSAEEVIKLD